MKKTGSGRAGDTKCVFAEALIVGCEGRRHVNASPRLAQNLVARPTAPAPKFRACQLGQLATSDGKVLAAGSAAAA